MQQETVYTGTYMFHINTVLFSYNYVVFIGNGNHILDRSFGQAVKHTKLKTGTNTNTNG